jgi:asparagine synthase (glutamine-hydrolysing)
LSGILGFWGHPPGEAFDRASASIAHWGRDRYDRKTGARFGLAFHGLDIRPESVFEALQPLPDGGWLLADAILDNRPELLAALKITSEDAATLPDSALLARAWERWGPSCVAQLVGDFAFAVMNPETGGLFLARDHIGARPLVFAVRPGLRAFASCGQAVLAALGEVPRLDEGRLVAFLRDPSEVPEQGLLQGLQDLPPGFTATVTPDGRIDLRRWWDPWRIAPGAITDPEEVVATFRALTLRAVHDRLTTSKPVGVHISGGIDSTLVTKIAAMAARDRQHPLAGAFAWAPTFDADHPDLGVTDERHRILRECGLLALPVSFDDGQVDGLTRLVDRPLEFEGTSDLADEFSVLDRAKREGIRVLLSGWGGDEAFSAHGIGMLPYLFFRERRWRFCLNALRRQAGGLRQIRTFLGLVRDELLGPVLPDGLFNLLAGSNGMFAHACYLRADRASRFPRRRSTRGPVFRPVADPMEYLRRGIDHGHIGERMKGWAHWGAEAGLQYRYPLTDRRLMEFVLGLSPRLLLLEGQTRALPKRAFADIWPEGAGKDDPANEGRRQRARHRFLAQTAAFLQEKAGQTDPRIDLPMLATAVSQPLDPDEIQNVFRFAEVLSAMRVARLSARCEAGDGSRQIEGND